MQADEAGEEEGSSEFHVQEFGADLWSVGRHGGLRVGKEGGQFRKLTLEASPAAQWLVFCTSTAGDTALIPIREIRSHMPHAAAKKQNRGHPLWLQSGRGCLSQVDKRWSLWAKGGEKGAAPELRHPPQHIPLVHGGQWWVRDVSLCSG